MFVFLVGLGADVAIAVHVQMQERSVRLLLYVVRRDDLGWFFREVIEEEDVKRDDAAVIVGIL